MNSRTGKECIETLERSDGSKFQTVLMSLSSTSHVYDPPAEDAVVPSGALHHPCEGQELGSGSGTPSMVQDPPAEDAMMHSGVLRHPREDPELVDSTLPTLLLTWELSQASVEYLTEPFTWSSSGQLSNTVYCPLEEYPDLCTLTVASGEISANIGTFLSHYCQLFQYIDQLPNAWLETYPSFAFYEGSMNVNGPCDPNTPQPHNLDPITNCFYLKKHYVDALATFIGSASTTAQRWYSHIQRNGFHVPVPLPLCEYPSANFRHHFKHHDTKVQIMVDVEIFLQHGYLCRGAVFHMEDLEDSCVSGVIRGLEQDGVPVFVVTILELWSKTVWDRIPCLKTPWQNMTNVSPGPEHDFLLISVEYAVPFDHPFPWFSAPTYGCPGFYYQYRDEKYYEEQAFLEALVAVDPQQESIPLLMKSYEVVAKFLGPGPFFCARNPPISVFPLTNPNAPGALESAQINPPLDPLLTT
ncbi:hypothetical protein BS47DRAFT_1362352 [Hydnum rufescens UP504]|uniref:Uncharacterized protein n=1 Tax=Hydnum rufescens UP504 TaxID=1448309 RepID=A0A9P6AX63_9AGAM|nr:hypothetical protein BS47DRAFT_1362352 [Hydnum rufescens UP504]